MTEKPIGRPSNYTEELADEICELIASGSNINRIDLMENMPGRTAIYRWLDMYPDFKANYTRAREGRADWRFDRMDDVILDMRNGIIDATQAKVELDLIKWQAGKEKPKEYGDKTTTEIVGKDNGPIELSYAKSTLLRGPVSDAATSGADTQD